MYHAASKNASEFIDHNEILDTLAYARKNCQNQPLINSILNKAALGHGLSHREAAVLLECELEPENKKIFSLAKQLKNKIYGNRIVLFAPLYLSNYCINSCTYCPYQYENKSIKRKKLSQSEIEKEVIALQDMGHKRLALETGEDPLNIPIEYILESIKTIYKIKHKNGSIRRVNVNVAATSVENYKKLKQAEIGTYILFQETYHRDTYEKLHPKGPKHNYPYHTEAMDRAMEAGIDDVGLGVLFGLNLYRYDFVGLLMHAEHLEVVFGVGPHTISVPRIRPAETITLDEFCNEVGDDIFEKIIATLRLAVPYTGMIVSTREGESTRERVIELGVSQLSGGSKTSVGGYSQEEKEDEKTDQFEIYDNRTLDQIVNWLLQKGFLPSFCTSCYREGRTGERFMKLAKSFKISSVCQPNALITLQEYLEDYASTDTKAKGDAMIAKEIEQMKDNQFNRLLKQTIDQIKAGNRDYRF